MSDDEKKTFRKELLDLFRKYGIVKEKGSTEVTIKTNGNGILSVKAVDIKNL